MVLARESVTKSFVHGTMLDVGCGDGTLDLIWRKRVEYAVGLDIYLPALKKAKRYYDDVVQCDIRFLPVKLKSFDSVISISVLEHLLQNEAVKLLYEIEEVARDTIVISTQHYFHPKTHERSPHKCFIPINVFRRRGFIVRGVESRYLERNTVGKIFAVISFQPMLAFLGHDIVAYKISEKASKDD